MFSYDRIGLIIIDLKDLKCHSTRLYVYYSTLVGQGAIEVGLILSKGNDLLSLKKQAGNEMRHDNKHLHIAQKHIPDWLVKSMKAAKQARSSLIWRPTSRKNRHN